MKKLVFLLICLLNITTTNAQWSQQWRTKENEHLLYANGDLMVGNSSGGNLGLSFVYKSKLSVEVGYSAGSNQIGNQVPILKSAVKSNAENKPGSSEMMENFNLMVGRHFNLNSKETIRFVLQGGPGMSMMMNMADDQQSNNENDYSKNVLTRTKDFSFIVGSKFEFPITDLFGFSAGPTVILNHEKRYMSFNVGFIYGIISKSN
jgi:hypothetical protein